MMDIETRNACAKAWEEGYNFSWHQERGGRNDEERETPSHLVDDLEEWNPYIVEAPRVGVRPNTEEEDALEQWAISDDREVREDAVVMGSTQEERDEMREVLRSAASEEQRELLDRFSKGGRGSLSATKEAP